MKNFLARSPQRTTKENPAFVTSVDLVRGIPVF
jgi:hypothetical protein